VQGREDLEKRVAELERQLAALQAAGPAGMPYRGVRKRASWGIGGLPFYHIALGSDFSRGELRGHAKGVIAIGDLATGFLAIGGLARGVVAIGGLAAGAVSIGGLSLGVLLALGGLAIGGVAFGGGALGGVAVGGGAVGYYACGGGTAGAHVQAPSRRDPEAVEFFRRFGLEGLCTPDGRRRF
jgi:hypothetical protein